MAQRLTSDKPQVAIIIAILTLALTLSLIFGTSSTHDSDVFVPSWQYPAPASVVGG